MKKTLSITSLVLCCTLCFSQSLKSPLMGWASWNNFLVDISESVIKGQADAMVTSGLSAAGYKYINIDDGFFNGRYSNGGLRLDTIKFPHKMKYVADYIHSKGLKAGYYTDGGANTCGSMYNGQTGGIGGGIYGHDQQDVDTIISSWGFDFLKADYCGGMELKLDEKTRYTAIRTALNNTGRNDINFNVCRWAFPGTWVTTLADSWRISTDIYLNWNSVIDIIDKNAFLAAYCSQGHYNDMDMLEVGRGLTAEEDKSHFSMWCIFSSPLVLGNDMRSISQTTKNILTNAEVIAVDQDTTGLQAKLVTDNAKGLQVWAKPLNGKFSKERAVVLFNRSSVAAYMSVKWKDLNLVGPATVRNLWTHADLGTKDSIYTTVVPGHGVAMLKVVGSQTMLQEVFEAEYGWINNFNLTSNSENIPDQGIATIDTVCSGRGKAGWLGNSTNNYLEFRDIYVSKTDNYNLKITYLSGENRTATMTINGKDTVLTELNSGSWTAVKTNTYSVSLKKGYNTIRFANATAWLPDFDKIQLDLNKNKIETELQTATNNKFKIYPNPCGNFIEIESESRIKQVSIYTISGLLSMTSRSNSRINISSLKAGQYVVKAITENGVFKEKFIKR